MAPGLVRFGRSEAIPDPYKSSGLNRVPTRPLLQPGQLLRGGNSGSKWDVPGVPGWRKAGMWVLWAQCSPVQGVTDAMGASSAFLCLKK